MYDLQAGKSASTTPTRMAAAVTMISTPLTVMNCPSRRRALAYPYASWMASPYNSDSVSQGARGDYAANGGDYFTDPGTAGWGASAGPSSISAVGPTPKVSSSTHWATK